MDTGKSACATELPLRGGFGCGHRPRCAGRAFFVPNRLAPTQHGFRLRHRSPEIRIGRVDLSINIRLPPRSYFLERGLNNHARSSPDTNVLPTIAVRARAPEPAPMQTTSSALI